MIDFRTRKQKATRSGAASLEQRIADHAYYSQLFEDARATTRRAEAARNRWRSMSAAEREPFLRIAIARYPQQTPFNQELYAIAEVLHVMKREPDPAAELQPSPTNQQQTAETADEGNQ